MITFIILGRSRTGSTLLISLFDSHPHIGVIKVARDSGTRNRFLGDEYWYSPEIFHRLLGKNYKDILALAVSKQPHNWCLSGKIPSGIKAKGFKIFYYHPLDNHSCGIWDELQSMKNLHVIHLKRKNILRTLLSHKIAMDQDVWSVWSDQPDPRGGIDHCVKFTVDELKKGFIQTRERENAFDIRFKNHPLLSINYEELINDHIVTFSKITEFLGVKYIEPNTTLIKMNNRSLKESITNYDELKLAFAETEWAHFFEE